MIEQDLPATSHMMMAVVTSGNGGYDKLQYKQVQAPKPDKDEVLIRVLAAGVNNTEINTRLGWYSPSVITDTEAASETQSKAAVAKTDGCWNAPTFFPLIQGADCCGEVVKAGGAAGASLVGKRVLVRA